MTFFRKKNSFSRPKFLMTFFWSSTMIFGFFISFSRFSISLLPVMSYMTLSSQEKPLFHKIILDDSAPFLLCSCFCTHPTNTTSQNIGGDGCMGRPPSQIFLGGPYPSSPRSPPVPSRKGLLAFGPRSFSPSLLALFPNLPKSD